MDPIQTTNSKLKDFDMKKASSINHALSVLNSAAEDSAEEIQRMVNKDYKKLKNLLSNITPEVKGALSEVKEATTHSLYQAKDQAIQATTDAAKKVDESAHKSPWAFIGFAAGVSALLGYLIGCKSKD